MSCISFQNVSRIYETPAEPVAALRDISLEIEYGAFAAIIGASGSGKTTFLNLAAGLDEPTQGEIRIQGQDISCFHEDEMAVFRRRHIGMVFQDCRLLDVLDVWGNITFPLRVDGTVPDDAYLKRLCCMLGIEKKLDALPERLSGESASGLRLLGHLRQGRRCCWQMSRPEAWTGSPAWTCWRCCRP